MTFNLNSSFLESNNIIGISVGRSAAEDLHNKLLINFNNNKYELHLAFHHMLVYGELIDVEKYIWDFPNFPESRLKALAARCINIINNIDGQNIPYALEYHGIRKFNEQGLYTSYIDGAEYGMTCATFILTVFESVGLEILDWKNWPSRNEDKEWFDRLIRLLNIHKVKHGTVSQEHIYNVTKEKDCVKIRPEEIFSVCYCNEYPMNYDCSSIIGSGVRDYLFTSISA